MVVSGVALAIPTATVWDFIRNGTGPRLGVTVEPVRLGRRGRLGLLIMDVNRGSPAEYASLLVGDLLIGANDTAFDSPSDLACSVREAGNGVLKLRFVRGDHTQEREVAISLVNWINREAA
jgi:serine protease Do